MQLLNIMLSRQLSEGEARDDEKFLADLRILPCGTIKTGMQTRFSVAVIVGGNSKIYASTMTAWAALGFVDEYYGFGSRVKMQVARDGVACFEHAGTIYTFAKVE